MLGSARLNRACEPTKCKLGSARLGSARLGSARPSLLPIVSHNTTTLNSKYQCISQNILMFPVSSVTARLDLKMQNFVKLFSILYLKSTHIFLPRLQLSLMDILWKLLFHKGKFYKNLHFSSFTSVSLALFSVMDFKNWKFYMIRFEYSFMYCILLARSSDARGQVWAPRGILVDTKQTMYIMELWNTINYHRKISKNPAII